MNSPAEVAFDLSWAEFDRVQRSVADDVGAGGRPDVVIGVLRSGMVPAVVLAHRLGVRDLRGFGVSRTPSGPLPTRNAPAPAKTLAGLDDLLGLDVVLVDAVAGSGATAEAATAVVLAFGPARVRRVVTVVNTARWDRPPPDDDPLGFFDHVGVALHGPVRLPWEINR